MSNVSVRRKMPTGVCAIVAASAVALASGCGARPAAAVGEPVIIAPRVPPTTSVLTAPPDTPAPEVDMPVIEPEGPPPAIDPSRLTNAAVTVEPNTTLGAVVLDRSSGQEVVTHNADRQFRSASLVKLLIAIDALRRGATEAERQRIARMLSASDDKIASALWVAAGPELVPRMATLIGLGGAEKPEKPGQWGEVKLTPRDVVLTYQYVMSALPPEDHTLIVDALARAPQRAADDFYQHFGIPDGLDAQWAIKQGWGNNTRSMVLHSTGLVGTKWRYVVVLMTEHPLGSGWKTSAKSVTAVADALNGLLPGA